MIKNTLYIVVLIILVAVFIKVTSLKPEQPHGTEVVLTTTPATQALAIDPADDPQLAPVVAVPTPPIQKQSVPSTPLPHSDAEPVVSLVKASPLPATRPATAEELAADPVAAGFEKISAVATNGVGGAERSLDQQWKRKNLDGTVQILTVRTQDGKVTGANLMEVSE